MFKFQSIALAILFSFLFLCNGSFAQASGNPEQGRELVALRCAACHGLTGNSPSPAFPILAGQHESYLLQSLLAYQNGDRKDSVMSGAIITLTRNELEDLAAYFAAQDGLGRSSATNSVNGSNNEAVFKSSEINIPKAVSPPPSPLETLSCNALNEVANPGKDSDNDGLADGHDAAPQNAEEFVQDADGDGRYEICTLDQMQAIQTLGAGQDHLSSLTVLERLSRDYELAVDLDGMGIKGFEPIGNCGPENSCMKSGDKYGFSGFFDGNSHEIKNLLINRPQGAGVGLFGVVAKGGFVGNLKLSNIEVDGFGGVGTIVGINFGTVFHCQVSGRATGNRGVGGLAGVNTGAILDCHARVDVSGDDVIGGAIGDSIGVIWRSSAQGQVIGKHGVGGLVAVNSQAARVVESYATGLVKGTKNVGGLVGFNTDSFVINSYAISNTTASNMNVGGLVGFNSNSHLYNSYANAQVMGEDAVGVLVGNNSLSEILNSYAVGAASGTSNIGGLVGDNSDGKIIGSYIEKYIEELVLLNAENTQWIPDKLPVEQPERYFCDLDGDGVIVAEEQVVNNYIWDFGSPDDYPAIQCTAGGVLQQRGK